jgi:ribosomal 50S subunit-recycling heat shock protein
MTIKITLITPPDIFQNNQDIQKAKKMVKTGDLLSLTVADTINSNAIELKNHFNKKKYFQTVKEKTELMVKKKVIPQYMINYYNKHK